MFEEEGDDQPQPDYSEKILATDHYEFWAGDVASIHAARITEHRDTLTCEVEVRWHGHAPKAGLLSHGKLNVLAPRSVTTVANECRDRSAAWFDWHAFLKWATHRIKTIWREGDQPIRLAHAADLNDVYHILEDFISADGPTLLIGAPGTTKSVIGAAVALTVASGDSRVMRIKPQVTGPVLFLDWELNEEMHKHRMTAMAKHLGIEVPENIHYRREYASLDNSAEFLRKYIAQNDIEMVVIDSVGKARGSDPNDGMSAIRFWQAVDSLRVPVVCIDHLSRDAIKSGKARGMGSIYNDAYVRLAWRLDAAQDGKSTTVVFTNWKNNFGLLFPRRSLKVVFAGDGARIDELWIEAADPSTVRSINFGDKKKAIDKIHEAVASSPLPMTVAEIAEHAKLAEDTVGKTLRRNEDRFVNTGTKAKGLWALRGRDTLAAGGEEDLPDPF